MPRMETSSARALLLLLYVKPSYAFALALAGSAVACGGASELRPEPSGTSHAVVAAATPGTTGDDKARVADASEKLVEGLISSTSSRCPSGMVDVEGRFCI